MALTVRELANRLLKVREDLQDKEIVIINENGTETPPEIKFVLKDEYDVLNKSSENVEKIVLK